MINKKRVFIALPFPDEFKTQLREAIFELKEKLPELRWLPEENWHITLVPPNDLSDAEIQETKQFIESGLNFKKFEIVSSKIILGPPGKPENNMVWLVFKNSGEFFELRNQLNGLLGNLENLETRPGNIHATLAKFREFNKPAFEELAFQRDFIADRIEIWESRLFSSGSVFNNLASINLL
ncbi:MAG: 2'-5' RNA ligase [Parcubacteria group bacterium GW2011_GWC1_45_9]|nr:MAG: 2'-5' RNA ligase [Parcubacteria group bacterium GW2011_GWC1_45_9]HCI05628.1 RNA 2',3'-cyclic phosphodiesterase [Patescibacteria group bacterium]